MGESITGFAGGGFGAVGGVRRYKLEGVRVVASTPLRHFACCSTAAMDEANAHHVQDVGKILLQAQNDLRQIRESLAIAGGSSKDGVSAEVLLQQTVEKVETELRLKAEAVLNTVTHGSVTTLPTLGAYNFSTSQPLETAAPPPTHSSLLRRKPQPKPAQRPRSVGDPRSDAIARPAAAAIAEDRHRAALRNPTSSMSRNHMAERFGITPPNTHAPLRPIGRDKPGKLNKARTSGALGVPPPAVRHDPQAVPPIGPRDVAAGLYSLVTRGLIPPSVDLTPAIARNPAPLKQAPAKVHDFKSQFAAHNSSAYISPFGFNVANTKLDLLSDVGVTLAERRLTQPAEIDTLAASAPNLVPVSSPEPLGADLPDAYPDVGGSQLADADAQARQFDELMDTFVSNLPKSPHIPPTPPHTSAHLRTPPRPSLLTVPSLLSAPVIAPLHHPPWRHSRHDA